MKKVISIALAAAMATSLVACGGSAASSTAPAASAGGAASTASGDVDYSALDAVELIGGDSTGKGSAGQIFGELVASKVDEITGGQLTIDYHPNGDLGGDADLLRQMQSNDIQLVVCQTAPTVSFIPEAAVFDLPMAFAKYDGDTIDAVLNGEDSAFHKDMAAAYENADFHLLGFMQNATYRLTTADKDLSTLADFKGLQIRTMENANHMAFWTAIGAEPTPLAWAEVYFALQSGTIHAQENAADTCVGANFQEVQKYLACTNHILYCNQICMSKQAWDELDPAYQAALTQAVNEAIAEMRPQLESIDQENKQKLADGGMTIIEYSNDFYDEVLAVQGVQDLYTKIDGDVNGLATTLQESLANA